MALNQNKIQSLHDNINSLDVQRGMQTAVVSIQKDIFDVFTENTVRVNDKKDIVKLEQGLTQRIDTIQASINGKPDTETIKDISVKEAKDSIAKLSAQKETLNKISDGIEQINFPRSIAPFEITPRQLTANLFTQDILKDQTGASIGIKEKGKSIKTDGDSHTLKITDSGSGWQIEHENTIIGRIDKVADMSWKTTIFPEKIKELGIKEIHLPFTTSKIIDLPNATGSSVGTSKIEKTKTWKIHTKQISETNTSTNPSPQLPPHTVDSTIDSIDKKMEQLLRLVNMADMRMRYNNIKTRWGTLKMHMQNFDKNQNINADTPLFRSIFPALEHEVNEFKKELTNAIIDTQDKLDRVKNSGIADLEKVKQLEQELEDIKAKYRIIQDQFDTIHKELFTRIYKKTPKELPPHTPTPTLEPDQESTENPAPSGDNSQTLEISAHLMDKESLVKKSIEQDVLEEYQHKYAKRRWIQRMAMYNYARFTQNRRIGKRLGLAKKYNDVIETDTKRQQRIASSIGNFAYEYDLGVDAGKVKKTDIGSNDEVNSIANDYIKGAIDRKAAVEKFNAFFSSNKEFQSGMTGSDIMEQLDDTAFMVAVEPYVKKNGQRTPADYKAIQEKIREFYSNHPTAKLHGIHLNNPHVASTAEMDKLCDHILAYKSKAAVSQLQNITANVKLYKVEKDTSDLTESRLGKGNHKRWDITHMMGDGLARIGALGTVGGVVSKGALAAALGIGGVGTLGIVGGVAGLSAVLQWFKTYRDYLTEAQKTHEDAMTMGTKELDKRIKELEAQIKKHTAMQKTMAWRGFGKHAIRTKQLNILSAVNDKMHKTGAIKPALTLIQEMQHKSRDIQATALADTLARLKMGRELDTNFISGSNRGLTEQERKDLLIQLREAGTQWATKTGYGHLVPERNASEDKWRDFWVHILAIPQNGIGKIYERKCTELKKNFEGMQEDIKKGRRRMARRDTGTNLATSATVAGVAAGVSAGWQAINGGSSGVAGTTVQGPHNEYALGQYETPVVDKAAGWETAFTNGDKVSFQGEAAVDAVSAAKGSFGNINKEIAEVTKIASSFDSTTQDAVKEALTTELAKVKAEAIRVGADAGNVALTQQRWVDGVEEIVKKLHDAGKTGVTIEQIKFDPSTFNPIDIQSSVAPGSGVGMQDIIDRSVAFEATIGGTTGTWGIGEPLWVVRPGFSNTYAKPGDESKHDDSWSKRTKDLEKKDKEEKQKEQQKDDYNKDFEKKYGLPGEQPEYIPVPPVADKDENRKKKRKDNKDKPFQPNDGGEQPQNHPYGDPDSKRGVSPRGREGSRTDTDVPRFFEKDYPNKPMILNPQTAAERIIAAKYYNRPLSDMPFISDPKYIMGEYTIKIQEALQNRDYQKAVTLLAENITKEQQYVDEQKQELGFNASIDKSLTAVDEVFDELGVLNNDRSEIPDKDHIHIIPSYLFYAQNGRYEKNTLGFIQFMNGHIFINYEALKHGPNGDRSPEEQQAVLVHAITHEAIHGTTTTNYHKTWKEKDGKAVNGTEDYVFLRRMGTQLVRRTDKIGNLKERGRALNEGLTESLNLYILEEKLGMHAAINGYPGERKIIDMLSDKFELKKTDLYKFLVHRKFGSDIIRKVYGRKEEGANVSFDRPGYITILMELMDMEHLKNKNGRLNIAEDFLQEKKITIKKSDSKNFHPSLINQDGSLKAEILQAYPFISQI